MKKIFVLLAALIMIGNGAIAQKKAARTATTQTQPVNSLAAQPVPAAGQKLKKDGTADMRYKANKEKKAVPGPVKKDGTPDKRFKANK
ncbi:MAG: hypothetical protein V4649_10120 [Bacteroidota bacterium]